jgi:hypothetical protein
MDVRPILPDEFAATHLGRTARGEGYGCGHNAVNLRSILPRPGDAPFAEAIELAAGRAGVGPHELLVDHTLLPVHYAFSDDHVSHSGRPDRQKFEALAAHRTRHLRFCSKCKQEDLAFSWVPYWRRSHQLPGVNFCAKHLCPLITVLISPALYTTPGELGVPTQRIANAEATHHLEQRIHDLWAGLLAHGRPISALATRHFLRNSLGVRTPNDEGAIVEEARRLLPADWLQREFGGVLSVQSALQARVLNVKDSVPTILLLAFLEPDVDSILNALIGSTSSVAAHCNVRWSAILKGDRDGSGTAAGIKLSA